jgi:hypothetical protein
MSLSISSAGGGRFLLLSLLVLFTPACATDGPGPGSTAFTDQNAIAFMRAASSAWIFTVDPDGTRGPLHKLDAEARRQFVSFISDPANFDVVLGMPIKPPEVGIEFRKDGRTFDLFSTWEFDYFYDHFQTQGDDQPQNFFAVLRGRTYELAQGWEKKYFPRPISDH